MLQVLTRLIIGRGQKKLLTSAEIAATVHRDKTAANFILFPEICKRRGGIFGGTTLTSWKVRTHRVIIIRTGALILRDA